MKKISKNKNQFSTSDLNLAAVISLSFPMQEINRGNPRKVQFIFEENKEIEELIKKYWNKELKVEPQEYSNQLRLIKNRIYSN